MFERRAVMLLLTSGERVVYTRTAHPEAAEIQAVEREAALLAADMSKRFAS